MNKTELVRTISEQIGLSLSNVNKTIDTMFQEITKALQKGDKVTFIGFGTFSISKRATRNGRNPKTGASIKISARNAPKFTPGKGLKSSVNS
jgi:DNA-binding protein HU-beta